VPVPPAAPSELLNDCGPDRHEPRCVADCHACEQRAGADGRDDHVAVLVHLCGEDRRGEGQCAVVDRGRHRKRARAPSIRASGEPQHCRGGGICTRSANCVYVAAILPHAKDVARAGYRLDLLAVVVLRAEGELAGVGETVRACAARAIIGRRRGQNGTGAGCRANVYFLGRGERARDVGERHPILRIGGRTTDAVRGDCGDHNAGGTGGDSGTRLIDLGGRRRSESAHAGDAGERAHLKAVGCPEAWLRVPIEALVAVDAPIAAVVVRLVVDHRQSEPRVDG
jgi:hypothetical protein